MFVFLLLLVLIIKQPSSGIQTGTDFLQGHTIYFKQRHKHWGFTLSRSRSRSGSLLAGIGGGAYLDSSNATFHDCRLERNTAEGSDLFGQLASFGGGVATRGPSYLTNIR